MLIPVLTSAQVDTGEITEDGYIYRVKQFIEEDSVGVWTTDYLFSPVKVSLDSLGSVEEGFSEHARLLYVNCKIVIEAQKEGDSLFDFLTVMAEMEPVNLSGIRIKELPVTITYIYWGGMQDVELYANIAIFSTCLSAVNYDSLPFGSDYVMNPLKVVLRNE